MAFEQAVPSCFRWDHNKTLISRSPRLPRLFILGDVRRPTRATGPQAVRGLVASWLMHGPVAEIRFKMGCPSASDRVVHVSRGLRFVLLNWRIRSVRIPTGCATARLLVNRRFRDWVDSGVTESCGSPASAALTALSHARAGAVTGSYDQWPRSVKNSVRFLSNGVLPPLRSRGLV